jgi:hypothetical protein
MRHALMYVGGFERNFPKLTNTTTTFEGSDGQPRAYHPWPDGIDGLRVCYMEKAGKKFVAVRVADAESDVVLQNAMILVPGEHFGFNERLSGTPTVHEDDIAALKMLEDMAKKNVHDADELLKIRARFKAAAKKK